jgi:hypothetical protein
VRHAAVGGSICEEPQRECQGKTDSGSTGRGAMKDPSLITNRRRARLPARRATRGFGRLRLAPYERLTKAAARGPKKNPTPHNATSGYLGSPVGPTGGRESITSGCGECYGIKTLPAIRADEPLAGIENRNDPVSAHTNGAERSTWAQRRGQ